MEFSKWVAEHLESVHIDFVHGRNDPGLGEFELGVFREKIRNALMERITIRRGFGSIYDNMDRTRIGIVIVKD